MSQSLQVLLEHSQRQRDDALVAAQRAQTLLQQQEQQAEQLRLYRLEYQQRHPARVGGSTTIDLLRHHQAFMDRLDQAVLQQIQQCQQAQQQHDSRCTELLALQQRVASVRKLLQRRAQAQLQLASRQDQRRSDDAAAQSHRLQNEHA
jgi:flagellar protein FliJ